MELLGRLSKERFEELSFGVIGEHRLDVDWSHEVDQLGVDVEPGLAAFAGLRVHLLLDLVAHFLDLEPFLTEQQRVRHVLCLSFDELTKELVVEVVVVEDLGVVLLVVAVLVAVVRRLLAQDIVGGPVKGSIKCKMRKSMPVTRPFS